MTGLRKLMLDFVELMRVMGKPYATRNEVHAAATAFQEKHKATLAGAPDVLTYEPSWPVSVIAPSHGLETTLQAQLMNDLSAGDPDRRHQAMADAYVRLVVSLEKHGGMPAEFFDDLLPSFTRVESS